jgi:deoxyribodipyrimidine photolyase
MIKNERLVPEKKYSWTLMKKDFNQCHQLFLFLAEKNGGVENLKALVENPNRVQKFSGIREVFDENCLERDETSEAYNDAATKFDKGFSRYLQSNKKIAGKLYPTYKNFTKHYKHWQKNQNSAAPVEEKLESSNDYSGIEALFTEVSSTEVTSSHDEVDAILRLSERFSNIKSPSGWEVTR